MLVAPPDGADLTELTVPLIVRVSDDDADAMQVKFFGRQFSQAPAPPFRMVALPDTQNYSMTYPQIFTAQTQWIVNNRQSLNIAYVAHEGDIVNNADQPQQWQNANTALSIFDTLPDLPFGLSLGNHDQNPGGNPNGTTEFNTYFPTTRYEDRPWYGGHYGTNNDNHYILFSAGGMDFIAIHFEYDDAAAQAVLNWAGGLLQTYPNRRAIAVAHNVINRGVPGPWSTQGLAIYNALKVYPSFFLMLCGHNHGTGRRADVYDGRTVYTLLADYQAETNGGNGYLRIMEFVPADNSINVTTYSPTVGQYRTDADNQFTLTYDMGGSLFAEIGMVSSAPSGSDVTFTWASLEPRRTYQWYATASDGRSMVTGPVWTFTIPTPPGPEITLSPGSFDRAVWIRGSLSNNTFTVTNTGQGTLNYTITDDADWLSISPPSGSSTGEPDSIEVVYDDVAGLRAGTHTAAITVAAEGAWNSPETVSVTVHVDTVGTDFDGDGDVDQEDFGHFQACLTELNAPPAAGCEDADLDENNRVDQADLTILQACLSGANALADPNCAG